MCGGRDASRVLWADRARLSLFEESDAHRNVRMAPAKIGRGAIKARVQISPDMLLRPPSHSLWLSE